MATRCNITFTGKGHADAGVFRFVNGDPDEVLADLGRFFGEVEAVNAVAAQRPGDSRFGHPEYLAARYLIWQTWRWAAEDHFAMSPLTGGNRDDIVAALAEASCRYPSALSVNICPDCAVTDANVWFLEIACELAGAGQLCDEHTADTKQAMRYAELEHILRSMP
jgi:hypothetical protein